MKNCTNMEEVRAEIDRVDQMVVGLITERLEYIRQAGYIKQDRSQVRDMARAEDVMKKVLAEGRKTGCDQNLITLIYEAMVEWSINYEFSVFDGRTSEPDVRKDL